MGRMMGPYRVSGITLSYHGVGGIGKWMGFYRGTGKSGLCAIWWRGVSGLVFMGRFLLLRSEPIEMIP
jgi:hypothetical protein